MSAASAGAELIMTGPASCPVAAHRGLSEGVELGLCRRDVLRYWDFQEETKKKSLHG